MIIYWQRLNFTIFFMPEFARRHPPMETRQPSHAAEQAHPREPAQKTGFRDIVSRIHEHALESDVYEDARQARDDIRGLQGFRRELSGSHFASFHTLIEVGTNINKANPQNPEGARQQLQRAANLLRSQSSMSPRVQDMFNALLGELTGEAYEPEFPLTTNTLQRLKDDSARIADLQILFDPDAKWNQKLNVYQTRLERILASMRTIDRQEGNEMPDDVRRWRQEQLEKTPTAPQRKSNRSKPGVDAMDRLKEGEKAKPIWTIFPPWAGHFKDGTYTHWSEPDKEWTQLDYEYSPVDFVALSGNKDPEKGPPDSVMTTTQIETGVWLPVPMPYTHGLHKVEVLGGHDFEVRKDQFGDITVLVNGPGPTADLAVHIAPHPHKKLGSTKNRSDIQVPSFDFTPTKKTRAILDTVRESFHSTKDRVAALTLYIKSSFRYLAPASKEEADTFNAECRNDPKGFATAVDRLKTGDCDVVNTLFSAMCAELGIATRHCTGDSVRGKNKEGKSITHSGTGHAWIEWWNAEERSWIEWRREDATPPGDPNEDENDTDGDSESTPGDFDSEEALKPTDEEIEKTEKEIAEHAERLSYTMEERRLSENTGVSLREARSIVEQIKKADNLKLPNGERIAEVLANLFQMIVQVLKNISTVDDGPVTLKEGGTDIIDLVEHAIGSRTHDPDPRTRKRSEEVEEIKESFGGLDFIMIGDKSSSMDRTIEGQGKLWELQRLAEYLVFSALHRFQVSIKDAHLLPEHSIEVRTQGISFRTSQEIDSDKPLSERFLDTDKVTMWHSLTGAPGSDGDVQALATIAEQIKLDIEKDKKEGRKPRLRVVIACSDGGYVGNDAVKMRDLAMQLGELGVVVVGMGISDTAKKVPVIMHNPPFSYGDLARDPQSLPMLIATHVIRQAIRLFPEKGKKDYEVHLDRILQKLNVAKGDAPDRWDVLRTEIEKEEADAEALRQKLEAELEKSKEAEDDEEEETET